MWIFTCCVCAGDLMSRSMIVTSTAARRKTDLTPVTPSPWTRGLGTKALTPSRPQTAAASTGTPKRAVSMSRLDILAQPRRRFTMEDLKSRSHSAWKLNDGQTGMKGARSMSHLSSTPNQPRLTRTTQMRPQFHIQSSSKGSIMLLSLREIILQEKLFSFYSHIRFFFFK